MYELWLLSSGFNGISCIPLQHTMEQSSTEPRKERYQWPWSQFLTLHFNTLIITQVLTQIQKACLYQHFNSHFRKSHICSDSASIPCLALQSYLRVLKLNFFHKYPIQKMHSKIIFNTFKPLTDTQFRNWILWSVHRTSDPQHHHFWHYKSCIVLH